MSKPYYTGIRVLSEIEYQRPNIAYFPQMQTFPLTAGFSWGNRTDMSFKQKDKTRALKNNEDFLSRLHVPSLASSIIIDPFIPTTQQTLEVTKEMLNMDEPIIVGSNILFTKDPKVTLAVHPGDCPCAVVYTKTRSGESLLGLIHLGRRQTDKQLAKEAITYLKILNINPETIFISISPGILQENYYIPENQKDKQLPYADKWDRYIRPGVKDSERVLFLDLHGYIIEQFVGSGIKPENIELYDIDTFNAAKKRESFSHRYAVMTNQPNDGRFLLAASLK